MTLLQFHEVAYDALIFFNDDDWPANETNDIPHAPSLPLEEFYDYRPDY